MVVGYSHRPLVNKEETEELALTLNDKKSNLNYNDLLAVYSFSGLSKKLLDKTLENLYYCRMEMVNVVHKSFLPGDLKNDFDVLLNARLKNLGFNTQFVNGKLNLFFLTKSIK
jgi:hypothetical protein